MRPLLFITFLVLCFGSLATAKTKTMTAEEEKHLKDLYEFREYSGSRNSMSILLNILNYSLKQAQNEPVKAETPVEEAKPVRTTPVVQKFAGNIYYDEYFTDSVYYDYIDEFFKGYSMLTYQYSEQCLTNFGDFMDVIHEFHLNMTRRRSDSDLYNWFDPYRLIAHTLGNSFNKFWFNCFQFGYDVYSSYD